MKYECTPSYSAIAIRPVPANMHVTGKSKQVLADRTCVMPIVSPISHTMQYKWPSRQPHATTAQRQESGEWMEQTASPHGREGIHGSVLKIRVIHAVGF